MKSVLELSIGLHWWAYSGTYESLVCSRTSGQDRHNWLAHSGQ